MENNNHPVGGPGNAPGGGGRDSGVEIECELADEDDILDSSTTNSPQQPQQQQSTANNSNSEQQNNTSSASSMSGTPEPAMMAPSPPNSGSSSGAAAAVLLPPPSVTEDGYLGDCSSDGGNEKNFPMPPEKLKRFLLLKHQIPSTSSSNNADLILGRHHLPSTSTSVASNDAVEPPAGLTFQNLQYDSTTSGYGLKDGGRKMKSSVLKSSRVHNHNNWSANHLKANISTRKLRIAVNTNNTELLERILASGADPNQVDEHRRTALHFAAAKGYTDVTRILISNGADPNAKDSLGNTALHLAGLYFCDILSLFFAL